MEETYRCISCGCINKRKRSIKCCECESYYHLSCVGLTRVQAAALGRWTCAPCRGVGHNGQRASQDGELDLSEVIGACHARVRVLKQIPRGAVVTVADGLQRLIRDAVDQGTRVAWGRLLGFSFWGLRCPQGVDGERRLSLATRVKQQTTQFLQHEGLPEIPVRVSPAGAGDSRTLGEDQENIKLRRRVAGKFMEGDVGGAVRVLASADGLAPYNSDTLEALRGKHPPAPAIWCCLPLLRAQ